MATKKEGQLSFVEQAQNLVFLYVSDHLEKTDTHVSFTKDDVYTVWYAFILGHHKHLISTTLLDGMYYEVTYNSSRNEVYLDAYKKFDNQRYLIKEY